MDIYIHRGLNQIGGCITEISTSTSRIFIDMGQNLPGRVATSAEEDREMVANLFSHHPKEHEAVIYTHAHEDHVGLFDCIPQSISQYIGEGSKEIQLEKYRLIVAGYKLSFKDNESKYKEHISSQEKSVSEAEDKLSIIEKFETWKRTKLHTQPESFRIGDITITPFYNCHSIYDSYMFLIEADGQRIWHTGDFRKHGYYGKGLLSTLTRYATNIDALIIEGTMLGSEGKCIHESVVSKKMGYVMQAFKYVFVLVSATNIERLAAINNASKKADKDIYVCSGLINSAMRIFTERESVSSKGLFSFQQIYYDESKHLKTMKRKGFVMLVGAGHLDRVKEISKHLPQEETLFIYSAWEGYYKNAEQVKLNPQYREFRNAFINVIDIHTSGHADRKTLEDVINEVHPKKAIIGIHKEEGQSLESLEITDEMKSLIYNLKHIKL